MILLAGGDSRRAPRPARRLAENDNTKWGNDQRGAARHLPRLRLPLRLPGECPKNRFLDSPDGEPGWNYLCRGYLKYFGHITQYMNAMAQLLAAGLPAAAVMEAFKGPLIVHRPPAAA